MIFLTWFSMRMRSCLEWSRLSSDETSWNTPTNLELTLLRSLWYLDAADTFEITAGTLLPFPWKCPDSDRVNSPCVRLQIMRYIGLKSALHLPPLCPLLKCLFSLSSSPYLPPVTASPPPTRSRTRPPESTAPSPLKFLVSFHHSLSSRRRSSCLCSILQSIQPGGGAISSRTYPSQSNAARKCAL